VTRYGSVVDAADRLQLVAFRPLEPANRPPPCKRYVGRDAVPLTWGFGLSGAPAADVLSGRSALVVEGRRDGERLRAAVVLLERCEPYQPLAFRRCDLLPHRNVGGENLVRNERGPRRLHPAKSRCLRRLDETW
jgi:hypothetical protein